MPSYPPTYDNMRLINQGTPPDDPGGPPDDPGGVVNINPLNQGQITGWGGNPFSINSAVRDALQQRTGAMGGQYNMLRRRRFPQVGY